MKNGSVNEIVECLRNGGVVLLPTDTVYGLAVSPNFDESIDRLFALKRRPRNVNLPIMVSSDDELEPLGFQISESARRLLRSPLIPGASRSRWGLVPTTGRRGSRGVTKPQCAYRMMSACSRCYARQARCLSRVRMRIVLERLIMWRRFWSNLMARRICRSMGEHFVLLRRP